MTRPGLEPETFRGQLSDEMLGERDSQLHQQASDGDDVNYYDNNAMSLFADL